MARSPSIIKRSLVIGGHKTSVTLEDKFWAGLKRIRDDRNKGLGGDERHTTLSSLVGEIDYDRNERGAMNLSSALRLHVLDWALERAGLSEITMEVSRGAV